MIEDEFAMTSLQEVVLVQAEVSTVHRCLEFYFFCEFYFLQVSNGIEPNWL